MREFDDIRMAIRADSQNIEMEQKGYQPVYVAGARSKILIISQAPGAKAQASGIPWDDISGRLLRNWLGVSDEEFYDPENFAIMPMDFYFPGKGAHGDLPPRKGFGEKWHPQLLELMPSIKLKILVGAYAQKHYLQVKSSLTDTVFGYQSFLPDFFPLVHPSPLNLGWRKRNPWFEKTVLPELKVLVKTILES